MLCAACTSARTQAGPLPSVNPSASASQQFLSGPCPVSRPFPRNQIPRAVVYAALGDYVGPPVRNIGNWYGNDSLWVELPTGSAVVKLAGEDLSEKFPWVRLIRGQLTIDGRRLDGPAAPVKSDVPDGYGPRGFQATGIGFPEPGCWEIAGRIAGWHLTFIVEARRGHR